MRDDDDDRPRKKARPSEDDEDDRPRKKRPARADDDADESRPPKKRLPRDDDDTPPRKRREEDDRPSRQKPSSRDEDDEEEVDRPRKRRRDDDEDTDRPAPLKKKKKKKKKSKLMRTLLLVGGGVCLLALIGVAVVFVLNMSWSGHESVARETISLMNETTDILEKVKDKESARAAVPGLEQVVARAKDLKRKMNGLPKITPEEDARLNEKYSSQLWDAIGKKGRALQQARIAGREEPTFIAVISRIQ